MLPAETETHDLVKRPCVVQNVRNEAAGINKRFRKHPPGQRPGLSGHAGIRKTLASESFLNGAAQIDAGLFIGTANDPVKRIVGRQGNQQIAREADNPVRIDAIYKAGHAIRQRHRAGKNLIGLIDRKAEIARGV